MLLVENRVFNLLRRSRYARLFRRVQTCWQIFVDYWRILNGDTAYHRYLAHWHAHHSDGGAPLTRAAFFTEEMTRRWDSVRRCC